MSAKAVLETMFKHHAWATITLLDHCSRLSADELDRSMPGTRGDILTTLAHIVGADGRYLAALRGQWSSGPTLESSTEFELADLRSRFDSQQAEWREILDRIEEFDLTLPARPQRDWPETAQAQNLMMLQAIHHGNDHRTQICSILGASGLQVPDLDGWAYWRQKVAGDA